VGEEKKDGYLLLLRSTKKTMGKTQGKRPCSEKKVAETKRRRVKTGSGNIAESCCERTVQKGSDVESGARVPRKSKNKRRETERTKEKEHRTTAYIGKEKISKNRRGGER